MVCFIFIGKIFKNTLKKAWVPGKLNTVWGVGKHYICHGENSRFLEKLQLIKKKMARKEKYSNAHHRISYMNYTSEQTRIR